MAVFLDHREICADILEYSHKDIDVIDATDKVHNVLQIVLGFRWGMTNLGDKKKNTKYCIKPFIFFIKRKVFMIILKIIKKYAKCYADWIFQEGFKYNMSYF